MKFRKPLSTVLFISWFTYTVESGLRNFMQEASFERDLLRGREHMQHYYTE